MKKLLLIAALPALIYAIPFPITTEELQRLNNLDANVSILLQRVAENKDLALAPIRLAEITSLAEQLCVQFDKDPEKKFLAPIFIKGISPEIRIATGALNDFQYYTSETERQAHRVRLVTALGRASGLVQTLYILKNN